MTTSYDLDPEPLISRLAGPLLPADRQAFREAALDALTRVPCAGEGSIYRAVATLQRQSLAVRLEAGRAPIGHRR